MNHARKAFLMLLLLTSTSCSTIQASHMRNADDSGAHFVFSQLSDGKIHEFVFELMEPRKIEAARAILRDPGNPRRHVQGTIRPTPVPYNARWSFHLIPRSIDFFELQIEVCDANVTYVEAHLDEVGGAFLPQALWCPWSSRIEREVPMR